MYSGLAKKDMIISKAKWRYKMKCFICYNNMNNYFQKTMVMNHHSINCQYVKCNNCGLVINKTYYEMGDEERSIINSECHEYQGSESNIVDPKWLDRLQRQAQLFAKLFELGFFTENMQVVDYGCGDAKFSNYVKKICGIDWVKNYDKYMVTNTYLSSYNMTSIKFDVVVTCSVFEHLIGMKDIDEIMSYLKDDGILCLHTLICEAVPNDPQWFYLLPPHCTLWTNKAMSILFEKYKFVSCAYSPTAKMWFFIRNRRKQNLLENLKKSFDEKELLIDDRFIEYWKISPYRNNSNDKSR